MIVLHDGDNYVSPYLTSPYLHDSKTNYDCVHGMNK